MVNNRIKTYWLLLLVLMYTVSITSSVTQSYAHYDSTVIANTVMESSNHGMTSNCLVKKGEPALTVLVGELPMLKPTTVSFWLKSNGADAVGNLAWAVADPDHIKYLQISMHSGPLAIDPEEDIELLKDVSMEFSLLLKPTELASSTVHEMLKINILVTWGDEMWGTFQVILPEVKQKEEPVDPEDPNTIPEGENTSSSNEITEPTVPEGENTGENNTGTGLIQPDMPQEIREALEAVLASGEEDDDGETTEPTTEPTTEATPEPTTIPITEPTTEPTMEPTTAPETQNPAQKQPIRMETLSRFDSDQKLPVKMMLTPDVTSVRLGLQVTEEGKSWLEPLPDHTRFSLNQGKSYYMMHDGYIAEFSVNSVDSLSLLLDFSRAGLKTDKPIVLRMEAYSQGMRVGTSYVSIMPDAKESCMTLSHPLNQQTRAVVFTEGDTREAAMDAEQFGWPSRTLSRNNALEFTLPMEWLDAEVEYSVDMLTMTEEQRLEYRPVTLSESGLYGRYMDYDLTHNLVFRVGENLPQAGTYRLNMKWKYEGICFAETQTTFFINYSAHALYPLGS